MGHDKGAIFPISVECYVSNLAGEMMDATLKTQSILILCIGDIHLLLNEFISLLDDITLEGL